MANRDLLKEAIADAKAVKEVAIANAKAALEEAFTPQLKKMFEQKINELDINEVDQVKLSNPDMRHGLKGDNEEEVRTYDMKFMEEGEEIDLEEILAELELDENARTDAEEEGYLDGMKDEKEDMSENARTDAEEEGYKDGMKDEKEDLSEESEAERADVDKFEYEKGEEAGEDNDEEVDLDDMSEEELKNLIEDVIADMVTSGELEAGGDPVEIVDDEEEVEDVDVTVDVTDTEEIELEENARTDAEEEGYLDGKADEKKKIEKDLKESQFIISHLRSELNEVNLLNSKLLYTNKIFKAKNLTENQKIKVLKAFDRAETVKEAKSIFETLNENLATKNVKSNIRESMGAASKPAGMAPKRHLNEDVIHEDTMVSRFKQLAGIK